MNIVTSVRVTIAMGLITALIVVPRILVFFGLEWDVIDVITSPWATFLVILIAAGIFLFNWIKSRKLCLLAYVAMVLVAFFLTFYFCQLPLPF